MHDNMKPLSDYFQKHGAYSGNKGHWIVAYTTNRDSDAIDRTNFAYMWDSLRVAANIAKHEASYIDEHLFTIERARHWAVGSISYLIVNPEWKPAIDLVTDLWERIDEYPCLDDDALAMLEESEESE